MNEIISELEKISESAKTTFGNLNAEQINWKPSAEKWSVGQCFDHLIKINSAYFPEFESIIKGERKQNFWENISPLSGFFGNLLVKSLDPKSERKLKAPKTAAPSSSDIQPSIIEDFAEHQAEVINLIRRTENLDPKKIILTSPFLKVITYSLFDGFRMIATHEWRHFRQAEKVMQAENFPR